LRCAPNKDASQTSPSKGIWTKRECALSERSSGRGLQDNLLRSTSSRFLGANSAAWQYRPVACSLAWGYFHRSRSRRSTGHPASAAARNVVPKMSPDTAVTPNFRQVEPDRRLAQAVGRAPDNRASLHPLVPTAVAPVRPTTCRLLPCSHPPRADSRPGKSQHCRRSTDMLGHLQ